MPNVYAEWIQENGVSYRRKTLLQFGDSIELIGSAVLMNPGKASPNNENFDFNIVKTFYEKIHNEKIEEETLWRRFDTDDAMRQLAKIFNGGYINEINNLNGIIQLFNCFYYRNQNAAEAREQFARNPQYLFNESSFFLDKPVYFGWGDEGKNGIYADIAREIYYQYNLEYTPIYNPDFDMNEFYHPRRINFIHNDDENVRSLLNDFYNLVFQE
ncbi:MAG: hypothetical protein FWG89_02285 [Treponema sp.]|nr:hypothetical protein [Treponema sp.]